MVLLAVGVLEARSQDSLESQLNTRLNKAVSLSMSEVKPNEIVKGDVAYSGIVVNLFTTDSLPELLNPFAPAKYGSAEDNTLRDSVTERAFGWKLFSIRF